MNERDSTENTQHDAPYEPPAVEDLDTSKAPAGTAPGVIVSGAAALAAPRELS